MTYPPEMPRLRTYEVRFGDFDLQLQGHWNADQGYYDTEFVDVWGNCTSAKGIKALLAAVQPDYDALIADCIRNGTATEI